MANFVLLSFLDTWSLASSLRSKTSAFAGEETVRSMALRTIADDRTRVHAEWAKWTALKNVVARISRSPAAAGQELGNVSIEYLAPHGYSSWGKGDGAGDGWQSLQLPLVTNPLAMVYCGAEGLHMPVGWLYWVNPQQPRSAVNMGDWPRYHLILEFRSKGVTDARDDPIDPP